MISKVFVSAVIHNDKKHIAAHRLIVSVLTTHVFVNLLFYFVVAQRSTCGCMIMVE